MEMEMLMLMLMEMLMLMLMRSPTGIDDVAYHMHDTLTP
jgi:hypothetical protein